MAFKNGIMDLETKHFREGIYSSDFITKTIPYNYEPADKTKTEFLSMHY
jgi:phage/plasmid-associated DNA primase